MSDGRKLRVVIVADGSASRANQARLDRQAGQARDAYPRCQVVLAVRPGHGFETGRHAVAECEDGAARMVAEALRGTREFTLVLPFGSFPGHVPLRHGLGRTSFAILGRGASQPRLNVADGVVAHMAFGASQRWTGAFVLTGWDAEGFACEARKEGRKSWMCHEVLNVLVAKGMRLEARRKAIDSIKAVK